MRATDPGASAEELLAHLEWVRRLARALVHDADAADDLAQEAVRVTLEQPRGRVGAGAAMRSWLRGVVRRLALDRFRSERSRSARERMAASRESLPGAYDVVERGARQRRVVEAVMELPEPYRSTILHRYLDELPVREVAARSGVSEEAVRKRLERGRALLRERLDAGFGARTGEWASILFSWPGATAVTLKSKIAVAAALAAGVFLTMRALDRGNPARDESALATSGASPAVAAAAEPGTAAESIEAERAEASGRIDADPATHRPRLRVRVVDGAGRPRTSGRLVGFESRPFDEHLSRRTAFDRAIAGEVTVLDLGPAARNVSIRAVVPGEPVSAERWASFPAKHRAVAPAECCQSDLTLALREPEAAPLLRGAILVDGERRAPRGLEIQVADVEPAEARPRGFDVRVDTHEASFALGPRPDSALDLWVTSDQTVPAFVTVARSDATFDLELASGRVLELELVQRGSRRPLPGVELYFHLQLVVERSLFEEHWRHRDGWVTSDEDGIARLSGVPRSGRLDLWHEPRHRAVSMPLADLGDTTLFQIDVPLHSFAIEPDWPAVERRTLELELERPPLRVIGVIDPAFLATSPRSEVFYAVMDEDGLHRMDSPLELDDGGGFELELVPGRGYALWVECERYRVSDVLRFTAGDEDVGPIAIAPRSGTEIVLRLTGCPTSGVVYLHVHDPGAAANLGLGIDLAGGTLERRFVVDGPTWVEVSVRAERGADGGERRRIEIDPAHAGLYELDLAAAEGRPVELVASLAELPVESALMLFRLDGETAASRSVYVPMEGGRSREPIAIAPGRYLYTLAPFARGVIAGIVEVESAPGNAALRIQCELAEHVSSSLGAGVRITAFGDEILAEPLRAALTLRLADEPATAGKTVLLPAAARIEPLPR